MTSRVLRGSEARILCARGEAIFLLRNRTPNTTPARHPRACPLPLWSSTPSGRAVFLEVTECDTREPILSTVASHLWHGHSYVYTLWWGWLKAQEQFTQAQTQPVGASKFCSHAVPASSEEGGRQNPWRTFIVWVALRSSRGP